MDYKPTEHEFAALVLSRSALTVVIAALRVAAGVAAKEQDEHSRQLCLRTHDVIWDAALVQHQAGRLGYFYQIPEPSLN